ncbi:MAG TPA: MerR family transcriptional regulator [Acidimicrobiia bacterium]|jgi:DNA-binding transcriptional MerR regulator|nr:MerR family transcriptional regulator [Acidimicrobiia bacterium]
MAATGEMGESTTRAKVEQDSLDAALASLSAGNGEQGEGFRGPQVCKIVGISYRQLDYWARTDLVRPSLADAHGSGTQRRYSYRDLVRLKVIKNLLDAGVKLQTARKAIEYIRGDLGDDWSSASLVLNGGNSVLVRSGDDLVDVLRHGQGVLNIVSLGQVVEELQASIHTLADAASEDATDRVPSRAGGPTAAEGG